MLLDVGYFWINAARVRHMGNAYRPIKETIIGFTRGLTWRPHPEMSVFLVVEWQNIQANSIVTVKYFSGEVIIILY